MKALLLEGAGNIQMKDIPKPKPLEGELLIRPLYSGVCFSELHEYYPGWSFFSKGIILGHEVSGVVDEVGHGVEGWNVGDRLNLDPRQYCGQCLMCRAGFYTQCEKMAGWIGVSAKRSNGEFYNGAHAEYQTVPTYACFKIPDTISDKAASQVEPLCCGTRDVRHSGMVIGDNVVFLGLDDYSTGALHWTKLGGANRIIVVDPVEFRRTAAKKIGADIVIDPTELDVVKSIREILPYGPDLVYVGQEDYIEPSVKYLKQAMDIVRLRGIVVLVRGYTREPFNGIDPTAYSLKEINLKSFGIFFGEEPWRGGKPRGDYQLTIDTMASGRINAETHIAAVFPFDEIKTKQDVDEVYQTALKGGKTIFKIWGK
ncbi:zinc-binding dehydrogenase [Chloroflexota bacterium]